MSKWTPGARFITDEQRAEAIRLYQAEVLMKEIAAQVGLSIASINRIVRRAGVERRLSLVESRAHFLTDRQKRHIVEAYKEGTEMKEIAAEYGISDQYIFRLLQKLRHEGQDIPRRWMRFSSRDVPRIVEEYLSGTPCYRIAQRLGCCPETVVKALKKAGYEVLIGQAARESYRKGKAA